MCISVKHMCMYCCIKGTNTSYYTLTYTAYYCSISWQFVLLTVSYSDVAYNQQYLSYHTVYYSIRAVLLQYLIAFQA